MNSKQVIKAALDSNLAVTKMVIADFTDAELLVRPVPGANHPAWQLGHLIASELSLLDKVPGAKKVDLPDGFDKQHGNENTASDSKNGFLSKSDYLALYDQVRAQTLAALDKLSEADLDKSTGWKMFPTVGSVLLLIATHPTMHSGQFTVLRRKLGKPVVL